MGVDREEGMKRLVQRLHERREWNVEMVPEAESAQDDYLTQIEEITLEALLTTPGEVLPSHPDTDLVRRIQRGDMEAFEALFFKYQGQIYLTASLLLAIRGPRKRSCRTGYPRHT